MKNMVKKCGKIRFENAFGKKCEKMRFENALGKKNVKTCEKTHLNIQLGRWNFDFCRLKIGEEQFKSIGSGLCRSQICSIYL